jgi:hypothetical protein
LKWAIGGPLSVEPDLAKAGFGEQGGIPHNGFNCHAIGRACRSGSKLSPRVTWAQSYGSKVMCKIMAKIARLPIKAKPSKGGDTEPDV